MKRVVFRAQAPENIAKRVVSLRRWLKQRAFCNVFWRLGAERRTFHDGLARLGARAARSQVGRFPPGGTPRVLTGATRREHIHRNPCRARPEPSQTIVKRLVFRAQAPENIAKRVVSLRHWTQNQAFCNVVWRLGAEKRTFYDGLARLGFARHGFRSGGPIRVAPPGC